MRVSELARRELGIVNTDGARAEIIKCDRRGKESQCFLDILLEFQSEITHAGIRINTEDLA
jgi:hypothetical protein